MKIDFSQIKTPSNLISLFRLLLAIPLWILLDYYSDPTYRIIVFFLCIFGCFTDLLDGYLARKYNEITEFGKIIDPLADKIAIAAVVIKLYSIGEIPAYYFWIIILRDFLIFTGGILLSNKIGKVLPSNYLGKIAVVSIGFVILFILLGLHHNIVFDIVFYISIALIIASFAGYLFRAIEFLRKENGTI